MLPLSCPIPSNINPLQTNGFMFGINKLPDLTFFCQEVNIPDMTLNEASMSTPFTNIPVPGDKIAFGELQITFLIDSEMKNFKSINNWLMSLGFPNSRNEFADFVRVNQDATTRTTNLATMSDANLLILNNNNVPVTTITFFDAFPVSLSSVTMASTVDNTQYLSGTAGFKYSHYQFT